MQSTLARGVFGARLHVRRRLAAPVDAVFAVLSDHEGMSEWPGLGEVTLIQAGAPRNGVGAVRRVKVMGLVLDEAIVTWEPPRQLDYRIVAGLPVEHLGSTHLEAEGDATMLTWSIRLESWVPFLSVVVLARLRAGFGAALDHVERRAHRAAAAPLSAPRGGTRPA